MSEQAPQESAYGTLLAKLASKKGWNKTNTKLFDLWRKRVADFESLGNPKAVQKGGPGRGMYQYETKEGSGTNKVAIQRLNNLSKQLSVSIPLSDKDRKVLSSEDPDFSKLSEDAQSAIFLADKYYDEGTKLDDLVNPNKFQQESYKQWRTGHWKGNDKDEAKKKERWAKQYGLAM